jgi:outer membrane protein assembly factor BamD (BamD/ComL family)
MNRFNDQRDDTAALNYFYKVLNEFPVSRAAERAEARIVMIRQRANEPVHKSSRELLANWQPNQQLDLQKPSLDPDMTLLSRRAVLKNRVAEAEELYLLALSDQGIPTDIKEKALYQMGLMFLSTDNPQSDREKAITYLRRLLVQFPDSDLSTKASRHLDQALNR